MDETLASFRYNWYETNICKFLEKYALPVGYEGDFVHFLKTYRDDFLKDFDELLLNGPIKGYGEYSEMIYGQIAKQFSYIKTRFSMIIDVIQYWEKSELGKVENLVNRLLLNAQEDFFITNINQNWYNQIFYRVRIPKEQGEFESKPLELFHIPYSKRFWARNDRYNTAGRSCLYLSSVLNLAWKECGMPETFYYSSFTPKIDVIRDWRFLCFLSPQKFAEDWLVTRITNEPKETTEDICRYLRTYPLIFACSIINKIKNVPYKPEYTIPQLLMQWIDRNFDKIKGVLYFPCTDYRNYRVWNGYNVVIPAKHVNECDYSEVLMKAFKIESPIFEDNHLTEMSKNKIDGFYEKVVSFSYNQSELSDCMFAMHRCMVHISEGIKNTQNVPSPMLLAYIEMLLRELDDFTKEYNLKSIIEKCRCSVVYQERYEQDYNSFKDLFNEFLEIINIIEKYHHHIERGILMEKI